MEMQFIIAAGLFVLVGILFALYGRERHEARHKPQRILERFRQRRQPQT